MNKAKLLDELIATLIGALNQSSECGEKRAALERAGVHLDHIEVTVHVAGFDEDAPEGAQDQDAPEGMRRADVEFLRTLRIAPDLVPEEES